MKVGLYLNNESVADVDLSEPEAGNPGVGGTQFNFVTMPYYFLKHFPDKVEFVWYANAVEYLPQVIEACQVRDCLDAIERADQQDCDMFIWRPRHDEIGMKLIRRLDSLRVKTIAWAHNTPNVHALNEMADSSQLKRFVCVSQEQLDRLRDHRIFEKSTCIFNGFDPRPYIPKREIRKGGNKVVYLGSLVPGKGFHHLARVWHKIREQVPDARLTVIGSGKLYDRNQSLGKWGLAEESYERTIRPHLSDDHGKPDPSVIFEGTLGIEKVRLLQQAGVGVVNPSGRTENCPGSALEFQAAGTPVVSGAYRGLLDTVVHKKTGLLGRSDKELIDNIVYLLKNKDVAKAYGENGIEFVKKKFAYQTISEQWLDLFEDVYYDRPNVVEGISQHPFNDYKLLREMIRLLRDHVPFLQGVPSLTEVKALVRRIR
jgi:glycosyltransferase involved in cell wall biosynthesis